jgi:beta-lactamase class A
VLEDLVKEIDELLRDPRELQQIKENETYKNNLYMLVQFLYTKTLSETQEELPLAMKSTRKKLLSATSLNNLYSFAI